MRVRFSLRTLLLAVAVLCLLLAVAVRFGPHIAWKIRSRSLPRVERIPTRPLVDRQPSEQLAVCRFGPIHCEVPIAFTRNLAIQRDWEKKVFLIILRDNDGKFRGAIQFPEKGEGYRPWDQTGCPVAANWSLQRIQKAMYDESSRNFSWFMSHRDLAQHAFLISLRSSFVSSDDDTPLEYEWRDDLDGTLVYSNSHATFSWSTTMSKANGFARFNLHESDQDDWIRHFCRTFTVDADIPDYYAVDHPAEVLPVIEIKKLPLKAGDQH